MVLKAWDEFKGFGVVDAFLVCKFKYLKGKIKKWRAVEYHKENDEILNTKKEWVR